VRDPVTLEISKCKSVAELVQLMKGDKLESVAAVISWLSQMAAIATTSIEEKFSALDVLMCV
jgi:hypothetical protein